MDTKKKFKITISFDENTETALWSGKCSEDELDQKFHDAIKAQLIEYKTNPQWCQLRAYNEIGEIIAQETFH